MDVNVEEGISLNDDVDGNVVTYDIVTYRLQRRGRDITG